MADNFTEIPVKGKKGNNVAGASTTNLGVLPALANAAAQSWTEGNQVVLSTDLSGNLRVLVTSALPAGANTIGNVGLVAGAAVIGAVTQSGTWTVATNADGTVGAGAAGTKSLLTGAVFNTAAPTLTNGQQAAMQADSSGNLKVVVAAALPAGSNSIGTVVLGTGAATIGAVNLNTGSNTIGNVGLIAGSAIVGKVGIDQTTPGTTNRVAANIDQIAGASVPTGNGTNGGAMRVVIANDNTAIPVTLGSSGTLVDAPNLTSASVAAGGSATLATAFITNAKTGKIAEVTASSSVRTKVVVQTYNGTTATTKRVFFVRENDYFVYQPKDVNEITFAGNGTNTVFQVTITNMDNANAADVYASISYYEV